MPAPPAAITGADLRSSAVPAAEAMRADLPFGPESDALETKLRLERAARPKPPVSSARLALEVVAYAGAGASADGYFGAFLGAALAGPLGVYAAGNLGDETGSLGWTYVGALGGAGVSAVLGGSLVHLAPDTGSRRLGGDGPRLDELYEVLAVLIVSGALIAGPIIGFNYSREYEPAGPEMEGPSHDGAPRTDTAFNIVPTVSVTPELSSFGAAGRV